MKRENKEQKIVINFENLREITETINALDFYSRIWIGQYLEIDHQMMWLKKELYKVPTEVQVTPLLLEIRSILLPELSAIVGETLNGSYGIFSDHIDSKARIAYDIQQVMRYTKAWFIRPKGGLGVDFDRPLWANHELPVPTAFCHNSNFEKEGHVGETQMELILSDQIQEFVLKEALAVKKCLYEGKIRELFTHYTDDETVLHFAENVEKYYKKFEEDPNAKELLENFPTFI